MMDKDSQSINKIFQLPIQSYNFANNTKWVFSIPVGYLLSNQQNIQLQGNIAQYPLNCKKIQFPDFTIGTTKLSYLSYGYDISTRQNTTNKGLTIQFLVSNNWIQYLMLLKWFNLMDYSYYDPKANSDRSYDRQTVRQNGQNNPYASTQGPMFPSYLYLMDNFDHRLCTILFQNSWLAKLSSVDLNYSNTSNTQISANFELKFSRFRILINDQDLKNMFPNIQNS